MSFTYTSNIPISGQTLNVTKNPINANFQAINQLVAVNHVGFNATGLGKHTKVEMVNLLSPFTGTVGEGTLYTQLDANNVSEMFYTPDASGNAYQMTTPSAANYALFGKMTVNYNSVGNDYVGGWTFIPGGLVLQYGYKAPASNNNTIPFPIAFTQIFTIQVTGQNNVSTISAWVKNDTLTNFQVGINPTPIAFLRWMAIGTI